MKIGGGGYFNFHVKDYFSRRGATLLIGRVAFVASSVGVIGTISGVRRKEICNDRE
jgi:hypothetical protein